MISHFFIGISHFDRALNFYSQVMAEQGLILKFSDPDKSWAAWVSTTSLRPLFLIGKPYDGQAASVGNGQMIALLAPTREAVELAYRKALSNGGSSEGPPGLRPQYHEYYYGAYFRDPDGNKLGVCCHSSQKDIVNKNRDSTSSQFQNFLYPAIRNNPQNDNGEHQTDGNKWVTKQRNRNRNQISQK